MEIQLEALGKKFERTWVFRKLDFNFNAGGKYAILGSNGSGKSTLLQIISAYQTPTEGNIFHIYKGKKIPQAQVYSFLSLATPYLDLPEELTLEELLKFHSNFKKPIYSLRETVKILFLEKDKAKQLKDFSSGMRQRVRLGLSLLFEAPLILLDEPTTHLDVNGAEWYRNLVLDHSKDRTIIISSNQPAEYDFCEENLYIEHYKNASVDIKAKY